MVSGAPKDAVSLPMRGLGKALIEVLVLLWWNFGRLLSTGVFETEREVPCSCKAQMLMASVIIPAIRRYLSSWFRKICCRLWVQWVAAGRSLGLPVALPICTSLLDNGGVERSVV